MSKQILFLILMLIVNANLCVAQENIDPTTIVKVTLGACELNSAHLDTISNIVKNEKKRVFAIFRAGKEKPKS